MMLATIIEGHLKRVHPSDNLLQNPQITVPTIPVFL